MEIDERDELVRTAIELALSSIFKSADVLKKAAPAVFEAAYEQMVQFILPLTYVSDKYLVLGNLTWAARCVFHLRQMRDELRDAGLLEGRLEEAAIREAFRVQAEYAAAAGVFDTLPGFDEDMDHSPPGLSFEKLIDDLNTVHTRS